MDHREATDKANRLLAAITPYCVRAEVAGSIRRGKMVCRDIEIVALPRWEPGPVADLFGEAPLVNRLHGWARETPLVQWIKPGTSEIILWQPKAEGRYWRGLFEGVKLDLFLPRADSFGAQLLIRTGSAPYSQSVVTHALRIGMKFRDGALSITRLPRRSISRTSCPCPAAHSQTVPAGR